MERFAWDAAGEQSTIELLKHPGARAALVGDIVATITDRGADGVNLDFEPLPRVVRNQFTALVRELRAAMNAVDPTLQLTFEVTADVAVYDVRSLTADDAADAAFLMGYEYRTATSRVAGSLDPLANRKGSDLRESVKAILRRTPADRLILGLPWYGRAWSTSGPGPRARTRTGARFLDPSTAVYADAVARAVRANRSYDRTDESAWSRYRASVCETCVVSWRQLWYDDVDAFRAKVGFALGKGLRGVGIWALGYQGTRPELWSVLRLVIEGATDATPPSGSAALGAASRAWTRRRRRGRAPRRSNGPAGPTPPRSSRGRRPRTCARSPRTPRSTRRCGLGAGGEGEQLTEMAPVGRRELVLGDHNAAAGNRASVHVDRGSTWTCLIRTREGREGTRRRSALRRTASRFAARRSRGTAAANHERDRQDDPFGRRLSIGEPCEQQSCGCREAST